MSGASPSGHGILIATEPSRETTSGLCESGDGRLAQSDRSLRKRPGTNKDNEKDHDLTLTPVPIAQLSKRSKPVQGGPSKTDPERVTCPVCQKDFKPRGLPIHQAKSGCKEKLQQQVQHRNNSKSEASNTWEENHSGIASRVSLKENEADIEAQSPKANIEQGTNEQGKSQTRLTEWVEYKGIASKILDILGLMKNR